MSTALNIEAITGLSPEELGLHPISSFLLEESGLIAGIVSAGGSYDYGLQPTQDDQPNLAEMIDIQNSTVGDVE